VSKLSPSLSPPALIATISTQHKAFVTMNFVKALLSLVMSNFVNGWFESSGAKSVFTVVAIANLAVSTFSFPMYIFGKRLRSVIARSNFHQKF
jgi:hypothetical protein